MIKAIVFDIGGVLLRTEDDAGRRALEKQYGLNLGEVDRLVFDSQPAESATIGKNDEEAIWGAIADRLALSPEGLHSFKDAFWSGDRLDEDLINFLQSCRKNYTTAILSNAWKNARATLSRKYGIKEGETVDHILLSSELGVAKPDPEIYRILAKTVQCAYHHILFVDDFIENITAARALGIQTIHYQPGMNLIAKIRDLLKLT